MAVVERDEDRVLFAPDVQGPLYDRSLRTILTQEPQLAIVGGPPIYLADFRETPERIDRAIR
ncbi:MAG: hypothetical protein GTO54_07210, partial [Nitrososphaeria archaeon]|nr:hypothetical protein [Nitrososphaeria archaeon]